MDVMTDNDEDLAAVAARGDGSALEALLERHYGRILRMASRHSFGPDDAEDLAQDICIKIARGMASFDGRARFTTWLFRLALNACRDHFRKLGRERRKTAEYGDFARLEAEQRDDAARRAAWLRETLDELDGALRETTLLVVDHGLSHFEVAEILGVRESTVSWRLHEVRKKLKSLACEERQNR